MLLLVEDRSAGVDPRSTDGRVVLDFSKGAVLRVRNLDVLDGLQQYTATRNGTAITVDDPLASDHGREIFVIGGITVTEKLRVATYWVGRRWDSTSLDAILQRHRLEELIANPLLLRFAEGDLPP